MQKLILIRGLPGSGKSTLAKSLVRQYRQNRQTELKHFEADMFFEDGQGDYLFDARKLGQAHEWCLNQTAEALRAGLSVVVANTFVKLWEMRSYLDMAREQGVEVEIIVCEGEYENTHAVPKATIQKMREQWESV